MVKEGDQLTHQSVNKRLRRIIANQENGKKGGAPSGNSNASKREEKQPKQPKKTTQNNPPLERETEEEVETEEETEEKNPIAAADFFQSEIDTNQLYLKIPLEQCAQFYFLNSQFQMAREGLAANKYMTIERLKEWAIVFIKKLKIDGITEKSLMGKDDGFVAHFANWMKYRSKDEDPAKFGLKSGKESNPNTAPFDREAHFMKMQEQLNRIADEKRI